MTNDESIVRAVTCLAACEGMDNPELEVRGLRADAGFMKQYRDAYTKLVEREGVLVAAIDALLEHVSPGDNPKVEVERAYIEALRSARAFKPT